MFKEIKILKFRNINNSDEGVAGVFVAMLVIGLVLSVISMIQTTYVPKWMEQREAEHMDVVANQFANLKFAIDTQLATKQSIPISTSITLGSKELQFLSSTRAFGSIDISFDEYNVEIINESNMFSYSLGAIRYLSENSYFLDQSYVYENGALLLSQSQGDIAIVKPSFSVDRNIDVNITLHMVKISGNGGKTSMSGYGSYPIQTKYLASSNVTINNVSKIIIETKHPNSWNTTINSIFVKSWLDENIDFIIKDTSEGISIEFMGEDKVNIILEIVEISVEIGPGWIE